MILAPGYGDVCSRRPDRGAGAMSLPSSDGARGAHDRSAPAAAHPDRRGAFHERLALPVAPPGLSGAVEYGLTAAGGLDSAAAARLAGAVVAGFRVRDRTQFGCAGIGKVLVSGASQHE